MSAVWDLHKWQDCRPLASASRAVWHLRFATTRYRPDVRLPVATTWGLKVPDTTCHMSISLDGFVAGPEQSREEPLGKRGRELHGWHLGDERANEADAAVQR